jgi:hypothetical protein
VNVSALSEFSVKGVENGTIELQSPELDLSGELTPLVSAVVQSNLTLAPTCGMQAGPDESSFTLEGGNGLPLDPEDALPGDTVVITHGDQRDRR